MSTLPELEIFRVGDLTDSQGTKRTFTAEDLEKIASAYSAENPAPIVVGHPKDDTPAYGWVDSLRVAGNKLLAKVGKASDTFVSAVRDGSFKRISVALFGADHGSNPVPGQFYLRHVGFLGGAAPAVPGLKPVEFANTDPEHVIEFEVAPIATDKTVPVNFVTQEEPDMADPKDKDPAEFTAEDRAELVRLRQEAKDREAADKVARTKADTEFVAKAVEDGRILPAHKEDWNALFAALPEDEITFSADRKESPRDFLKAQLAEAKPQIVFEATSPKGERDGEAPKTAEDITVAANQFIAAQKEEGRSVTFAAAVAHVTGEAE